MIDGDKGPTMRFWKGWSEVQTTVRHSLPAVHSVAAVSSHRCAAKLTPRLALPVESILKILAVVFVTLSSYDN